MNVEPKVSTRDRISLIIYGMTNAVLFGIGIVLVLSTEWLLQRAWVAIPIVVVVSLVLAWPISWLIAPRLRQPIWRRRELAKAGGPVGTPEERRELAAQGRSHPPER